MPSSEVTAGHNPSRISIDNGTFAQNTKKFSTVQNENTKNHFNNQSELQLRTLSDGCSKFIPNWVNRFRIFKVHQISFIKCINVKRLFYQTSPCVVIFVQIWHIIPVYFVVWVSLQMIIKTIVCVTSFDGIFMSLISALLILTCFSNVYEVAGFAIPFLYIIFGFFKRFSKF